MQVLCQLDFLIWREACRRSTVGIHDYCVVLCDTLLIVGMGTSNLGPAFRKIQKPLSNRCNGCDESSTLLLTGSRTLRACVNGEGPGPNRNSPPRPARHGRCDRGPGWNRHSQGPALPPPERTCVADRRHSCAGGTASYRRRAPRPPASRNHRFNSGGLTTRPPPGSASGPGGPPTQPLPPEEIENPPENQPRPPGPPPGEPGTLHRDATGAAP